MARSGRLREPRPAPREGATAARTSDPAPQRGCSCTVHGDRSLAGDVNPRAGSSRPAASATGGCGSFPPTAASALPGGACGRGVDAHRNRPLDRCRVLAACRQAGAAAKAAAVRTAASERRYFYQDRLIVNLRTSGRLLDRIARYSCCCSARQLCATAASTTSRSACSSADALLAMAHSRGLRWHLLSPAPSSLLLSITRSLAGGAESDNLRGPRRSHQVLGCEFLPSLLPSA
jgi:hypothetical protein